MAEEARHHPQRVISDSADLAGGCSRLCEFNLDKKNFKHLTSSFSVTEG